MADRNGKGRQSARLKNTVYSLGDLVGHFVVDQPKKFELGAVNSWIVLVLDLSRTANKLLLLCACLYQISSLQYE